MGILVLVSPRPLAGKTTLAAALAHRLRAEGRSVSLERLEGGDNAAKDSAFFVSFVAELGAEEDASKADLVLKEAPADEASPALERASGAKALVVADGSAPADDIAQHCQALEGAFAGVIVNRTPQRRAAALRTALEASGLKPLAMLPEDRLLASPSLGEVTVALDAQTMFFDSAAGRPLERLLIASIAADPGQEYFAHHQASTVIVRGDKPDLQLAALNAGVTCLIVTGGLPMLSYVLERAEEDEIPVLRTNLDTLETVQAIEALYGTVPFSGGQAKLRRLDELLLDLDVSTLTL